MEKQKEKWIRYKAILGYKTKVKCVEKPDWVVDYIGPWQKWSMDLNLNHFRIFRHLLK